MTAVGAPPSHQFDWMIAVNFRPHLAIDTDPASVQQLMPPGESERFEGIAFSAMGLMAIATSESNSILLFRRRADGSYEETAYCRIGGASGLQYPHDVSFATFGDTELLAVAQRGGAIALYVKNRDNDEFGGEPAFEISGPQARLAFSDGVAFVPPRNDHLAVCNLELSSITFYPMLSLSPLRFATMPAFELRHPSIRQPDGLAFSRHGRWLAVANHGNHSVSIFARSRGNGLGYDAEPVSVIRDRKLRHPHSVAFTPRGRHLVVTNAAANYICAYAPKRDGRTIRWSKSASSRTIAGDEAVFRDINARNKMEGGPKGVAIYQDRLAVCSPEFGVNIYRFHEGRRRRWPF